MVMTKIKLLILSLFILVLGGTVNSQNFNQPQDTSQSQNFQQIKIGYVNSDVILSQFPEREQATKQLLALNEEYKSELQLMQSEYNKKYSDYITYQSSLAENIKLRRMQELTELENRMQEFMTMAQQDIEFQEKEKLEPLKQQINEAIRLVGIEQNFTVIYDLANPGIAFVSPMAEDANSYVKQKLGIQ